MKKPDSSTILSCLEHRGDTAARDEVWQWVSSDEKNREEFYRLKELWALRNVRVHSSEAEIEMAVRAFNDKIDRRSSLRRLRRFAAVASSAAAIFAAALLWIGIADIGRSTEWHTITASADKVSCFTLDDGSKVYLNKSSELSYREDFNTRRRDVRLDGEAYFEVAHNPSRPFTVHSPDDVSIRVLGTSFNVRTGAAMEVVLEKGQVALTGGNGSRLATLSPEQRAVFDASNSKVTVERTATARYTSWRFEQKVYDDITMAEIVRMIEERYDVSVSMDLNVNSDNRYHIVVNNGETLDELLSMLEYLTSIEYKIDGRHVMIKPKT